jgi:glycosyltransferase involved in cell wall biosynthesis
MAQAKPVVVTHSKTLKYIVESTNCGRIYKDDSPANLAKVIIELKCDSLRKKLGQEGYRAVQEKFNWEEDKKVLINAVKHFFQEPTKGVDLLLKSEAHRN